MAMVSGNGEAATQAVGERVGEEQEEMEVSLHVLAETEAQSELVPKKSVEHGSLYMTRWSPGFPVLCWL